MEKADIASRNNDAFDIDRQLMVCMGDYCGRDLIMYNEDLSKSMQIDLKDFPFVADPRYVHEVLPVTEGTR